MDELSAPAVYAVTAAAIPDQRALRDPAGACIADQRQDLDNAGFAGTVTAVAAVFAAAGLGRDGVLAVMMPNRVELVTSMLAAWRLGASVHRRAVSGGQFLATVEQVRPTYFSAVPTIYALLASRPGAQPDTRSQRFVICGAAPMPRQLIGEFEERFGVPVVEGHGLSECTVVCTANPLHGVRKAGSVGLPLPGIGRRCRAGRPAAARRAGRRGGRPRAERHARLPGQAR
jgi:acyl-CoA synthetase (AMP-forming)/AMP-acid ligase II